jgi:hypothetical protein
MSLMRAAAVALLIAGARAAQAADGVLEINELCALVGGCFPGDAPGFPVEITAGGSYRLSSALLVGGSDVTAISITASDVTLDLAGFGVRGPVTCSGVPPVCTPSGTGIGISGASAARVRVRDGFVSGMGSHGVALGPAARVDGVIARSNGGAGISLGMRGAVVRSSAQRNGGDGITTLRAGSVRESTAALNGGAGIGTGEGSLVRACTVTSNARGIDVALGSVVIASMAYENSGNGFDLGPGSLLRAGNAAENSGDGVSAGAGSSVQDSASFANGAVGLDLGANSGYGGNNTSNNLGGTVAGGVQVGGNVCDASTICP